MILISTRSLASLTTVGLLVLAGCSSPAPETSPAASTEPAASQTPDAAPSEAAAPATSAPAAPAPKAKGAWKQGQPVPKASLKAADVKVPDAVGERVGGETADGMTMYQAPSGGSIGTIAVTKQPIDFYLKTMQNPVDYGDFICAEGAAWGGGPSCMIGLADGTLSFQNAAGGPTATVEHSAQFAAEALAQMNVK